MDMDLIVQVIADLKLPPEELAGKHCKQTSFQGSGPGGQHRNRVRTGVRLEHLATGIRAEGSEFRESVRNRSAALERLRIRLVLEAARLLPQVIDAEKRTDMIAHLDSLRPFLRTKINPAHPDYAPALLWILGMFALSELRVSVVAGEAGQSTRSILSILHNCGPAWQMINQWRQNAGLSALVWK